ncbi:hypothetical protein [Streptomyces sp. enrichment culture]|uniref:hypothetical protein n=1 Tax=Streptomyces sp. enrichment culture TaxID=1795815 RepID=UPI003F57220B
MALPLLASVEELQDYLQQTVPLAPGPAQLALRLASAAIRRHTKQTISFVAGETITTMGGERVLKLPQRPVVVDADNPLTVIELVDASGLEIPAIEERDFLRYGSELHRGEAWPRSRLMGFPRRHPAGIWADRVKVTYSHGYQEIPDEIVGIALDLAAASMSNPRRLRSETSGAVSVTYTVETFGTGSLTSDHRAILRDFKRSTLSVRLS